MAACVGGLECITGFREPVNKKEFCGQKTKAMAGIVPVNTRAIKSVLAITWQGRGILEEVKTFGSPSRREPFSHNYFGSFNWLKGRSMRTDKWMNGHDWPKKCVAIYDSG